MATDVVWADFYITGTHEQHNGWSAGQIGEEDTSLAALDSEHLPRGFIPRFIRRRHIHYCSAFAESITRSTMPF